MNMSKRPPIQTGKSNLSKKDEKREGKDPPGENFTLTLRKENIQPAGSASGSSAEQRRPHVHWQKKESPDQNEAGKGGKRLFRRKGQRKSKVVPKATGLGREFGSADKRKKNEQGGPSMGEQKKKDKPHAASIDPP